MRRLLVPFAFCLAAAVSGPDRVLAWGGAGHKAVCQIAFLELGKLNPAKQQKVTAILAKETAQSGFRSFAVACTWPDIDKHRSGTIQNKRRNEHFIDAPRDLQAITTADCFAANKCLFTAISQDKAALTSASGVKQRQALKFLGHWIGDIHQPLHVSFEDDAGGNDITVKGLGCKELHGTWDTCVPLALMKALHTTDSVVLGTKLDAEITDADRAQWQSGSPASARRETEL